MEGERTSAIPRTEDVVVEQIAIPRLDRRTVGLAGVKAARAELDKAKGRATRRKMERKP